MSSDKQPAVTIDRENSIVEMAFTDYERWERWASLKIESMADTGPGRELAAFWDDSSSIDRIGLYGFANDSAEWQAKTQPRPGWTTEPPTEAGTYWHWNGDNDCAPLTTFVMWSGTSGKCFVSMGQLGLSRAIDCDEYGGWWMPLPDPALPTADQIANASK